MNPMNPMKPVVDTIIGVLVVISWTCGVVLAQGWYKVLASVFPPYAWYKVCEKVLESYR